MKLSTTFCLALSLAAAGLPAIAASSAASSASEGVSTSVGSSSTSIEASSNSSTGDKKVAQGEYRIVEMAALAERPEFMRVKLAASSGAAGEFFLTLPRQTAEKAQLAPGLLIQAQDKPYGLAFALVDAKQPFFLVMDDEWHRELKSHPVQS